MRFGKQLHKIIMDSIQDEDEASVGFRAFDLTSNGCSFRVKVDRQGEFPSYVTSKFLLPAAVPNVGESETEGILNQIYNLKEVFTLKSDEELDKMLSEHFYCGDDTSDQSSPDQDLEEEVPMDFPKSSSTPAPDTTASPSDKEENSDEVMEKLLAGLDDWYTCTC